MFEGRAPPDTVLLTTFVGGMRNPGAAGASDGKLGTSCMRSSRRSSARAPPLWTDGHALAAARFRSTISAIAERLRPLEDAERALPGLFFCANYRGGVSVGDCIKSAHAMADAATRFLSACRPA